MESTLHAGCCTADGLSDRIGTYAAFYEHVVLPRWRLAREGHTPLPAYAVMGRYYLNGDGRTHRIIRKEEDTAFFDALPEVMTGDAFFAARREAGITHPLWSDESVTSKEPLLPAPDATCDACGKEFGATLEEAARLTAVVDGQGARFTHPGCPAPEKRPDVASPAQMLEAITTFVQSVGFGPDLKTSVANAPPPPAFVALLRKTCDGDTSERTDAQLTEQWTPAYFTVASDIGTFGLYSDGAQVAIFSERFPITAKDVGYDLPNHDALEDLPDSMLALVVRHENVEIVMLRLCVQLLKLDRQKRAMQTAPQFN